MDTQYDLNLIKITVIVTPNSKIERIIQKDETLKVYVNALAVDGKANKAVIKILSKYFKVKTNAVEVIKGAKSRNKIIQINLGKD